MPIHRLTTLIRISGLISSMAADGADGTDTAEARVVAFIPAVAASTVEEAFTVGEALTVEEALTVGEAMAADIRISVLITRFFLASGASWSGLPGSGIAGRNAPVRASLQRS